MKMASVIHIIGFDLLNPDIAGLQTSLSSSVALVASKRLYEKLQLEFPQDQLPPLLSIVPLSHCITAIQGALAKGDVTVLASGDPLFYGIARKILQAFPDSDIRITPALSSMQLAFARFNIPWDDARFVSLHGRNSEQIAAQLLCHPKVFLLTDPQNSPNKIAGRLLAECGEEETSDIFIYVAEHLGSSAERLFSGNIKETASGSFADPNVMILLNPAFNKIEAYPKFGLQEKEIVHSRGLLTKNEVRAAVIHALRLSGKSVLWDVGAGSGSVGLEAACLFPDMQVLSIEKDKEQWRNIEANRKRFSAWNMELIRGQAPEALQNLPSPARVFVGGSGGNLEQILEACTDYLLPGGIIVVNAVIEKTAKLAPEILYNLGLNVELKKIAVQRFSYPANEKQEFNPIKIIVGQKSMNKSGEGQ
ncbi:MAG TPA: precorrin-6y C5,15-methyltransferase (decarboxylating) subunit CbiE [Desulfocapsa sulfexigens]|nr:precorrin-6y C5,15-methyltransferase (decarboxylating) subunit CbiE [Desulfocapsa sulfexigens]